MIVYESIFLVQLREIIIVNSNRLIKIRFLLVWVIMKLLMLSWRYIKCQKNGDTRHLAHYIRAKEKRKYARIIEISNFYAAQWNCGKIDREEK